MKLKKKLNIYETWNYALGKARGEFISNANIDDARHYTCIERQAQTLRMLPFVDIVYQDYYVFFQPNLSFDYIEKNCFSSKIPIFNINNISKASLPHNAPMWRRSLHDELGFFDEIFQSSGDWDFWLRCAAAGKTFLKLEEQLAGYYFNPNGLSTREGSKGKMEDKAISLRYFRALTPQSAIEEPKQFLERCRRLSLDPTLDEKMHSRAAIVIDAAVEKLRRQTNNYGSQPKSNTAKKTIIIDSSVIEAENESASQSIFEKIGKRHQIIVLDRGYQHGLNGIQLMPYPDFNPDFIATESLLLQKYCDYFKADAFITNLPVTPIETSMFLVISKASAITEMMQGELRARKEVEFALRYAQKVSVLDDESNVFSTELVDFLDDIDIEYEFISDASELITVMKINPRANKQAFFDLVRSIRTIQSENEY
jgi:hypothetical protein